MVQLHTLENGGGDFLDGHRSGVHIGHLVDSVHVLGVAQLVGALAQRSVVTAGPAFLADLAQPDGQ